MENNLTGLSEALEAWPNVKFMCTACGLEASTSFDPNHGTVESVIAMHNKCPCDCGAKAKMVKIDAFSTPIKGATDGE